MILFYIYAEMKEMIYESMYLKGVVYKPKQNSFSPQSKKFLKDFWPPSFA